MSDRHSEWFDRLLAHAHENYENGWDFFVECMDDVALRRDCIQHELGTWEDVFSFYNAAAGNRQAYRDDIVAEGYEDNMTDAEADADALASAGWGTDEDYGYFGGDD